MRSLREIADSILAVRLDLCDTSNIEARHTMTLLQAVKVEDAKARELITQLANDLRELRLKTNANEDKLLKIERELLEEPSTKAIKLPRNGPTKAQTEPTIKTRRNATSLARQIENAGQERR